MKKVEMWQTDDGNYFPSESEAQHYELRKRLEKVWEDFSDGDDPVEYVLTHWADIKKAMGESE